MFISPITQELTHAHHRGTAGRNLPHEYGGYGSQGYGSQGQGYEGHRDADFGSQYSDTGGEQRGRFQNDPDYHQWRQDQLRQLDDDYDSWRKERYERFADDFNTWRTSRGGSGQKSSGSNSATSSSQGTSGKNKEQVDPR